MPEEITRVNEDIRLIQRSDGHLFGTDAYLLSAFVPRAPRKTAAELGAGSGIVSMLCASRGKYAHIDAVEIQPEMAEIAKKNVELNGLSGIITVHCADVREYRGSADAVFANPPYIKADAGVHNPDAVKNASRRELHGGIDGFVRCASALLSHGGVFCCVWRPDRLTDLLCSMRECSIEPKRIVEVFPEKGAKPCLVLCEGKKGGNPGALFIAPPFLLAEDGRETEDCRFVYERGEFGDRYTRP